MRVQLRMFLVSKGSLAFTDSRSKEVNQFVFCCSRVRWSCSVVRKGVVRENGVLWVRCSSKG
jgi:hypothetical protein